MESGRSITQISRTSGVPSQNMHHYISKSPWSGQKVIKQIRLDIANHAHFASGSVLIGDESTDEKMANTTGTQRVPVANSFCRKCGSMRHTSNCANDWVCLPNGTFRPNLNSFGRWCNAAKRKVWPLTPWPSTVSMGKVSGCGTFSHPF